MSTSIQDKMREIRKDPTWLRLTQETPEILASIAAAVLPQAGSSLKTQQLLGRVRWLLERAGFTHAIGIPAYPPSGVPVLTAPPGAIGFVSSAKGQSNHAAGDIGAAWRSLAPQMGLDAEGWHIETQETWKDSGGSDGFSVFLACFFAQTGLRLQEDVCVTGAWESEQNLAPVHAPLLLQKMQTAKRWGYRRLLVPAGQQDIPVVTGIEAIRLSPHPNAWLAELCAYLHGDTCAQESALHVIDRGLRSGGVIPSNLLAQQLRWATQASAPPSVQALALAIIGGVQNHEGNSQAIETLTQAFSLERTALRSGKSDWRTIAHLRHELPAKIGISAIDRGAWEDARSACWGTLQRRLDQLVANEEDVPASTEDRYARMVLDNTLARRQCYLGRLMDDASGLRHVYGRLHAWTEPSTAGEILDFARAHQLRDTSAHRQWNQTLDTWLSLAEVEGRPPALSLEGCWALQSDAPWENEVFDAAYHIAVAAWLGIDLKDRLNAALQAALKPVISGGRTHLTYPHCLVLERLVRHRTPLAEQAAQALLKWVWNAPATANPNSILSILRLRTWAVLEQARRSGVADLPVLPVPIADWGLDLRRIAERMLPVAEWKAPSDAAVAGCVRRGPY